MKTILLFGLLLLVLGGAAIFYGVVGKILQKMFPKKEKMDE